jgi:DNA-directed RNA polymerase subunit RPC12/RpoP
VSACPRCGGTLVGVLVKHDERGTTLYRRCSRCGREVDPQLTPDDDDDAKAAA